MANRSPAKGGLIDWRTVLGTGNASSLPGLGHADMVRSCRCGVSLTYQEICYVVIQAKGLSFLTTLGK